MTNSSRSDTDRSEILAACHVHSSWSYDGSWDIDALVETFGQRGHRVLMMTEHDRGFSQSRYEEYRAVCARATTSDVFVLPGLEYSDPDNRVHVLVWGPVPFLGENLPTEVLLEAVADCGGVAVLAHPARRGAWECFKPEWGERLTGIEAWNRKYDGWAPGEKGAALLSRTNCLPFVGLDFHTKRQLFPLAMALEVDAIDEWSIIDSLRKRRAAPRAFGAAFDDQKLKNRLPLLKAAEQGRRKLASLKRYSKARLSGGR
jgi:hypothetical protein